MIALHIALYTILATSLVFAIIELGLCAYVATFYGGTYQEYSYNASGGYSYQDVKVSTPSIVAFLIFSAVWTILITLGGVVLSWFYTRKGVSEKISTILGIVFAVVYFVTMVFWLACFADIASYLDGFTSFNDYYNAVIAFAVLLWYSPPSFYCYKYMLCSHLLFIGSSSSPSLSCRCYRSVVSWCRIGWVISPCASHRRTRPVPLRLTLRCR